jgi:ribosome production factor 2
MGDKVGRIHMGKQDLNQLQTRKMKGLKRSRDVVDENFDDDAAMEGVLDETEGGVSVAAEKKAKIAA